MAVFTTARGAREATVTSTTSWLHRSWCITNWLRTLSNRVLAELSLQNRLDFVHRHRHRVLDESAEPLLDLGSTSGVNRLLCLRFGAVCGLLDEYLHRFWEIREIESFSLVTGIRQVLKKRVKVARCRVKLCTITVIRGCFGRCLDRALGCVDDVSSALDVAGVGLARSVMKTADSLVDITANLWAVAVLLADVLKCVRQLGNDRSELTFVIPRVLPRIEREAPPPRRP